MKAVGSRLWAVGQSAHRAALAHGALWRFEFTQPTRYVRRLTAAVRTAPSFLPAASRREVTR